MKGFTTKSARTVLAALSSAVLILLQSPQSDAQAARVCSDVFSAATKSPQIVLLSKADVLEVHEQIKKTFPYDSDKEEFDHIRGHLEKVAAEQNRTTGVDRYWVVRGADGKVAAGAGLYFSQVNGDNGMWIDWFFVDPSARGTGLGKKLLSQAIEYAKQLGVSNIRLYTTNRREEAAANTLYQSFKFDVYATEPELDRHGAITLDGNTGRPVTRIFRKLTLIEGDDYQGFMPGGRFRGELLDPRFRSIRLLTNVDPNGRIYPAMPIVVANVSHLNGFYNAHFTLGSVSRVILQDVFPKKIIPGASFNHIRLRFDFSTDVELRDPVTGQLVAQTKSLVLNVGKQGRASDPEAFRRDGTDGSMALFYSMLSFERVTEKMTTGNESGRRIEQHELQLSPTLKQRVLMIALQQSHKLGSNIIFDPWWANCTTQLYLILSAAFDNEVTNTAHKQRLTSYFQNQAALAAKVLNMRFWKGLTRQIVDFTEELSPHQLNQSLDYNRTDTGEMK